MTQWGAPPSDAVYEKLTAAYSESHRHYHTGSHIADCLSQFDEVADLAHHPEEVELAIWFHDAIYKPTSSTNEHDSAQWAVNFLKSFGSSTDQCERIYNYIMATKHSGDALSGDSALVVDIDVSILGRDPKEYDIYEAAIRKEYRWVPGLIYRRKRIEILQSFLNREALYETEHFRSEYEEQARLNLQRAISSLSK